MSDATRIHPPAPSQTLPVPSNSQLAPRTHAPTLIGGQADPDSVMVWSPDLKKLRTQGALWGAMGRMGPFSGGALYASVLIIPALASKPSPMIGVLLLAFLVSVYIAGTYGAEKSAGRNRPCYLSTDESGIGVTTLIGTAYFRWEEIVGTSYEPAVMILKLYLANGEFRRLYLLGYTKEQTDTLVRLACVSSELHLTPGLCYLRDGFEILDSGFVVGSPGAKDAVVYDWGAPPLPNDGKDLEITQKEPGVQTLRPNRERLALSLLGWSVGALGCVELMRSGQWFCIGLFFSLLIISLQTLLPRPHYCSTNDNGIRIPSTIGPCALRWDNITSLDRRRFALVLGIGETMRVQTFGCKRADVDALVDRIVDRAQLVPDPKRKNRWIHRSAPELGSPRLAGREL